MAELSRIKLPSGNVYDLKDATARKDIETLSSLISGGITYIGTTPNALVDGDTTNPITVNDEESTKSVTVTDGMMVNYNNVMYCWNGTQWDQLGSAEALGEMAYVDGAGTTVTPTGRVSTPIFTGTETTVTVTGIPSGMVSTPMFIGNDAIDDVTITPFTETIKVVNDAGTLPKFTATVENEILSFSWDAGSITTTTNKDIVTGIQSATVKTTPSGIVTAPLFVGEEMTSSGKFVPYGTNSTPEFEADDLEIIVTPLKSSK